MDVDRYGLERSLGWEEHKRMRLLEKAPPALRPLRAFTNRTHDVCGYLCPIVHSCYTVVQTGLHRVARKRTVEGDTENTCAKRRWKHDLDKLVVACMAAAQDTILGSKEELALPLHGDNGSFVQISVALFLEDFCTCYR